MLKWFKWLVQRAYIRTLNIDRTHVATTDSEKQAIYQFRYKVYKLEMGKSIGDPKSGVKDDVDDHEGTINLYYGDIDNIQGTMRLVVLNKQALAKYNNRYPLTTFADLAQNYAMLGRLMVRRDLKNPRIFLSMLKKSISYLAENNIQVDVILLSCKPGLVKYYGYFGSQSYCPNVVTTALDGAVFPLAIVFSAPEYFKTTKSPFYSLIKTYAKKVLSKESLLRGNKILDEIKKSQKVYSDNTKDVADSISKYLSHLEPSPFYTQEEIKSHLLKVSSARIYLQKNEVLTLDNLEDLEIYLVSSGAIDVIVNEKAIATLHPGDLAGEMAFFLPEQKRSASLKIVENAELVLIRRGELKRLIQLNSSEGKSLLFFICQNLAHKVKGLGV